MKEELFNAIIPVITEGQALIGISTLGGEENFFDQFLEAIQQEDKGKRFKIIKKILVCDSCMKQGLEFECTHKLHELPWWLDRKRLADIKLMMADESDYLRELKGLPSKSTWQKAFSKLSIENLFAKSRGIMERPEEIYISIDPSGGGRKSKYTITSCCYVPTENSWLDVTQVILAIDYEHTINVKDCYDFIHQHISKVLKQVLHLTSPPFPKFKILIEKCTGLEALHVRESILNYNRVALGYEIEFYQEQQRDPHTATEIGLYIGGKTFKDTLSQMFKRKFEAGKVALYENFQTLYKSRHSSTYGKELLLDELKKELENFGYKILGNQQFTGNDPKILWSGKHKYGLDDKVLTLITNFYYWYRDSMLSTNSIIRRS